MLHILWFCLIATNHMAAIVTDCRYNKCARSEFFCHISISNVVYIVSDHIEFIPSEVRNKTAFQILTKR